MQEQKIKINTQIAAILTYPEDMVIDSNSKYPAVLLLHGFGTDKNEVDNVYQKIASELAKNNIISLRIDFRGCGESTGKTEDFSVDDMLTDAITAFDYLTTLTIEKNHLGVIGFSLGAAIALLLSQHVSFNALALISPTLHLEKDFEAFLGSEKMTQLAKCDDFIEIDLPWRKIDIGKRFFASLSACRPSSGASQFRGNLLCIAGDKDFSAENAKSIIDNSPSQKKTLEIINNADHVFNVTLLPTVATKVSHWMSSLLQNKLTEDKNNPQIM